jgi:outer membrane protein OmpA-like peptidoglycan-associated protein
MLTITLGTLLLAASPPQHTAAHLTRVVQEPLNEQAKLPNAVVFFLPNSSVLSAAAADILTVAARNAGLGTIVVLQARSDRGAGETTQMAAERADAVRLALIQDGVPASAIRTVHADVYRTGIESRTVIVSVISAALSSPRLATD